MGLRNQAFNAAQEAQANTLGVYAQIVFEPLWEVKTLLMELIQKKTDIHKLIKQLQDVLRGINEIEFNKVYEWDSVFCKKYQPFD